MDAINRLNVREKFKRVSCPRLRTDNKTKTKIEIMMVNFLRKNKLKRKKLNMLLQTINKKIRNQCLGGIKKINANRKISKTSGIILALAKIFLRLIIRSFPPRIACNSFLYQL